MPAYIYSLLSDKGVLVTSILNVSKKKIMKGGKFGNRSSPFIHISGGGITAIY